MFDKEVVFYFIVMLLLVLFNGIQIGRNEKKRIGINIFQMLLCIAILVWYVFLRFNGGVDGKFYFISTVTLIINLLIEAFQLAHNEESSFFDVLCFLVSFLVVAFAVSILSSFP